MKYKHQYPSQVGWTLWQCYAFVNWNFVNTLEYLQWPFIKKNVVVYIWKIVLNSIQLYLMIYVVLQFAHHVLQISHITRLNVYLYLYSFNHVYITASMCIPLQYSSFVIFLLLKLLIETCKINLIYDILVPHFECFLPQMSNCNIHFLCCNCINYATHTSA